MLTTFRGKIASELTEKEVQELVEISAEQHEVLRLCEHQLAHSALTMQKARASINELLEALNTSILYHIFFFVAGLAIGLLL